MQNLKYHFKAGRGRKQHLEWILIAGLLTLSCLRPSEERVELDKDVGIADNAGVTVEIDERLGAIRALNPGELEIWAQSPVVRLAIDRAPGGVTDWQITVRNGMPDAELTAVDPDGQELPVQKLTSPIPTEPLWDVDLTGVETAFLTVAPPDHDTTEPYRFVVLSDIQRAFDRFDDVITVLNDTPDVRFVVSTGDLMSQGTRNELRRFQEKLRTLKMPWYSTVGNHENGAPFEVWAELFGPANFQFSFKGTFFTLVDSSHATLDPSVYVRLEDWLQRAEDSLHVFLTHITPVDPVGVRNGSFRSRAEAAKLLTQLAEQDVDVTFYGHIHSYYAFSNGGIPAYISGGGGAIEETMDGIGRHFLVVTAYPGRQELEVAVVRVD